MDRVELIQRMLRRLALLAACLVGCAAPDPPANGNLQPQARATPEAAGSSTPGFGAGAQSAREATSVVLLRVRQTLHGKSSAERKALWPWLANIDKAEPFHRVDGELIPAALSADGWIAWHLPAGSYQVVISGYASSGVPPRTILDRYRFRIPSSGRAFYLGSLAYSCDPAWWFEALCPNPPLPADDLVAAQPVAQALGLPEAIAVRFERVPASSVGAPGTDPSRIRQVEPTDTLLMVDAGQSVRAVHDYLAQARSERAIPAQAGGTALIQLAPYGPLAIIAVPIVAIAEAGVSIHRYRLTQKMQCLQRIWDHRADSLARQVLEMQLRHAADGMTDDAPARPVRPLTAVEARDRYRHILALNVQRLAIQSCHPAQPWLPDPRGKRFCMEVSLRARVYGADSTEPLSDEVFSVVPQWRVGREFEPTGWPIPPDYLYESRLEGASTVSRTYDEYCVADGFALVEADLRRMLEEIVPQVLTLHGILRARLE